MTVTVDDCAVTALETDIKWFMDNVEKRFNITRDTEISKHLGVEYEWGEEESGEIFCKATMKKEIAVIVDEYEKYIGKKVKEYDSPGIPNEALVKNEDKVIDIDNYRSFVGKIMFVATKVCPKIGSTVRAFSSHMSNSGTAHWNTMNR